MADPEAQAAVRIWGRGERTLPCDLSPLETPTTDRVAWPSRRTATRSHHRGRLRRPGHPAMGHGHGKAGRPKFSGHTRGAAESLAFFTRRQAAGVRGSGHDRASVGRDAIPAEAPLDGTGRRAGRSAPRPARGWPGRHLEEAIPFLKGPPPACGRGRGAGRGCLIADLDDDESDVREKASP